MHPTALAGFRRMLGYPPDENDDGRRLLYVRIEDVAAIVTDEVQR